MGQNNAIRPSKTLGLMRKCEFFRQHAGLTKVDLASHAGVSRDTVAKVERQEPVTLEKLNLIAKVLEEKCKHPFIRENEIQPV